MAGDRLVRAILICALGGAPVLASPLVPSFSTTAAAQTVISVEFRTALTPYGAWRTVPRWGEVWVPARLDRNWVPYTRGHWVYTDEFGWYWVSDESEAEWGWVTYHYGRWVFVDAVGWVWVPGNVWGPAWVDWRRGDGYVGWAPLPPDEVVVEYRTDPRFWLFVRLAEIAAPRPRFAFVPFAERRALLERTVVVNRTVVLNERRFAVNPGVAPAIVAAAARQPVRTFEVRPQVVAGTANIQGATQVNADALRRGGNRPGQAIAQQSAPRQAATTIQPAASIPPPQPLGRSENGRLGENPPRAATGARAAPGTPSGTTGAAPNERQAPAQRERTAPGQAPGAAPGGASPGATGAAPSEPQRGPQREERGRGGPPGTTGAAPPSERQSPAQRERTAPGATPGAPGATPSERRPATPTPQRDERGQSATPPGTTGQAPPSPRPSAPAPQREERRAPATPPAASPPAQRPSPPQTPQGEERRAPATSPGTTGQAPPSPRPNAPPPQQQGRPATPPAAAPPAQRPNPSQAPQAPQGEERRRQQP